MYSVSPTGLSVSNVNLRSSVPLLGQKMPPSTLLNPVSVLPVSPTPVVLSIASPVECVVYVPLTGEFAGREYLQVPTVVLVRTNVIGFAAAPQAPPRTWNSSEAIVGNDWRHQGVPFSPTLVSTPTSPNVP